MMNRIKKILKRLLRSGSNNTCRTEQRSVWLRVGVEVYGSKEEIDALVDGNGDLNKLLRNGQFEFYGDSYIPEPEVENYNETYNTNFEKGEIEYAL